MGGQLKWEDSFLDIMNPEIIPPTTCALFSTANVTPKLSVVVFAMSLFVPASQAQELGSNEQEAGGEYWGWIGHEDYEVSQVASLNLS